MTMKPSFAIFLVFLFIFSGCATPTPQVEPNIQPIATLAPQPTNSPATPTIAISNTFRSQLLQFSKDAGTLVYLTEDGINYQDYKEKLSSLHASYDILKAIWPAEFAPNAETKFDHTFLLWDLYLDVWQAKVLYNTVEIDVDSPLYSTVISYTGDSLQLSPNPVKPGTTYFNYDQALPLLFQLAKNFYQEGQTEALSSLD